MKDRKSNVKNTMIAIPFKIVTSIYLSKLKKLINAASALGKGKNGAQTAQVNASIPEKEKRMSPNAIGASTPLSSSRTAQSANGTSANGAVLHTATGAATRGLEIIVPVDGISATYPYEEQYSAWHLLNAPGTRRRVILTKADMINFV